MCITKEGADPLEMCITKEVGVTAPTPLKMWTASLKMCITNDGLPPLKVFITNEGPTHSNVHHKKGPTHSNAYHKKGPTHSNVYHKKGPTHSNVHHKRGGPPHINGYPHRTYLPYTQLMLRFRAGPAAYDKNPAVRYRFASSCAKGNGPATDPCGIGNDPMGVRDPLQEPATVR